MEVVIEPGQVLVSMGSSQLEAVLEGVEDVLEGVLVMVGSKVAEHELELELGAVMKAMHLMKVAVAAAAEAAAAEAGLTPKEVEVDLVLGFVTMVVAEADAVVVGPTVVVAGALAELDEPKEVVLGLFSGLVPSMADAVESLFVVAVSIGFGVAVVLVLEFDPR